MNLFELMQQKPYPVNQEHCRHHLSFTQDEMKRQKIYIDRALRGKISNKKLCTTDNCKNTRHVSESGRVYTKCNSCLRVADKLYRMGKAKKVKKNENS